MRHRNKTKKMGVNPSHRKALKRNLVQALFDNERIITTVPKAKAVRPFAEKLITLGKDKTLHNIRRVVKLMGNRECQMEFVEDIEKGAASSSKTVLQKLFNDIGPRNKNRPGGYTRIVRLARRRLGDGGERCIFELVESGQTEILKN